MLALIALIALIVGIITILFGTVFMGIKLADKGYSDGCAYLGVIASIIMFILSSFVNQLIDPIINYSNSMIK
ncbi:MAG: hypothetical protein ACYC27_03325 [Armatimonadota bacterium]